MNASSSGLLVALALTAAACSGGADEAPASASPAADVVATSPDEAPSAPRCTHDCGAPPASKPTTPGAAPPKAAGPAWLAHTWWRDYSNAGDSISERWTLAPDGTGELSVATVRPLIPYGAGDTVSKTKIHWSATGSAIDLLSSAPQPYTVTPNCHLLAIGDVTLEGGNKDCPFEVPALTAEEAALVGHWDFFVGGNGGWSGTWADVYFQSDRDIVMNYHASTYFTDEDTGSFHAHDYFTLGTDGVLHGVSANGTEELQFQLTLANGTLTLCNGGCIDLTKK
jgi:hypothetical protein